MASKISQDTFKHIAHLSRLPLDAKDNAVIDALSQAADYVEVLNELNTSSTPPTSQVNNKNTVLREDVILPSFSQKEALSQAPSSYQGYFKTSATIKK